MATTPGGLPYPIGTDYVVNGDNAIQALAEGVESRYIQRGTTAQRDARYGLPANDAAAVALANTKPVWFNTDTGYEEAYFAKSGTSGLTVTGVLSWTAHGWYPTEAGSFFAHKGRTAGAQTNAVANTEYEVILDNSQIRRGITDLTTAQLRVPVAGFYRATIKGYWTGLGAVVQSQWVHTRINGVSTNPASNGPYAAVYSRPAGQDAVATGGAIMPLNAGDYVSLWWGATTAGVGIWGNDGYNGVFLELEYVAPPLVNGAVW